MRIGFTEAKRGHRNNCENPLTQSIERPKPHGEEFIRAIHLR